MYARMRKKRSQKREKKVDQESKMNPIMPFFGEMLEQAMFTLDVTQEDLARALKVKQQSVSQWLKKGYIPEKRIDDVITFIKRTYAQWLDDDGMAEAPVSDKVKQATEHLVLEMIEVLAAMKARLQTNRNRAIEELKDEMMLLENEKDHYLARLQNEQRRLMESMETLKHAKVGFGMGAYGEGGYGTKQRNTKGGTDYSIGFFDGVAASDKPTARRSKQLAQHEAGEHLESRRMREAPPGKRHPARSLQDRLLKLAQSDARNMDGAIKSVMVGMMSDRRAQRRLLKDSLEQLPADHNATMNLHGRGRTIDLLTWETGIGINIAQIQVGRNQIDWRPVIIPVMDMAMMLKINFLKQAHIVVFITEGENELHPNIEEKLEHVVKDAFMLDVTVHIVIGSYKDAFAKIYELAKERPFDPADADLPFEPFDDELD